MEKRTKKKQQTKQRVILNANCKLQTTMFAIVIEPQQTINSKTELYSQLVEDF